MREVDEVVSEGPRHAARVGKKAKKSLLFADEKENRVHRSREKKRSSVVGWHPRFSPMPV
jgi:D-hexose-6-phosphate mutarotase